VRPRWHIGERRIFNYLWVFIGSGEGLFKVGEKEFSVYENDFVWVPPDTLFEMRGISEKMHCIFAHVDLLYDSERSRLFRVPDGVRDLSPWKEFIHPPLGVECIDSLCGLVKLSNPLQVKILMEELCRTSKLRPEMSFKQAGLLLEIIQETLTSSRPVSPLDKKIEKATIYIRENLNSNLNVNALAKSIGLSASYFRSIFRKKYNMGPVAFHRHLRIKEACNLMLYEGLNVSETAEALGFANVHNFSRAFKDIMKISPSHQARL
jgi:AraC-like DNA-binding protein